MAELKFEEALARLEEIVGQLEKGDLPLEESLRLFEEGVGLSKTCIKKLDEAEKKIEILIKNREGGLEKRPFMIEGQERENGS